MAATLAELEMRIRALEARSARHDENLIAHADLLVDTNTRVRRMERGIEAIAVHLNVAIPADPDPDLGEG